LLKEEPMSGGKDRGKHDGGRDASGRIPPGGKHPDSQRPTHQPESGVPVPDEKQGSGERSPAQEDL
jgi:hypothetical protein